jgi:hypothetical protein
MVGSTAEKAVHMDGGDETLVASLSAALESKGYDAKFSTDDAGFHFPGVGWMARTWLVVELWPNARTRDA